jgi:hypothetical protein
MSVPLFPADFRHGPAAHRVSVKTAARSRGYSNIYPHLRLKVQETS